MPFSPLGLAVGLAVANQQNVPADARLRVGLLGGFLGYSPIGLATTLVLARREADSARPSVVPTTPTQAQVEVPDVEGLPFSAAEAALQAVGLKAIRQNIDSATTPTDAVVSQVPAPPAALPVGATVTLRVSQGFLMPDLTGKTRTVAEELLAAFTVTVTSTIDPAASGPPNTVVRQNPEPNARVSPGATVTLTISPPPLEELQLQRGPNNIAPTLTEPVADYAKRVTPNAALVAIWEYVPETGRWKGYSPVPGAPNDLDQVTRLRPVFVVVNAAATISQPQV